MYLSSLQQCMFLCNSQVSLGKHNNASVPPEKIYEEVLTVNSINDIFDSIQVSVFIDEFTSSKRIDITSFTPKVDLSVGEGRCFSLNYPPEVDKQYVTTMIMERWEREDRLGGHVFLKIGHPGQVYTRELETMQIPLDSKTHIYLASPTAQILLADDPKSSCSEEMSYGYDNCFDERLTTMLLTEGGCTPPYVINKTNICNSQSDWKKFAAASSQRDSLVKSHRYRICPRPCATMRGNLKFVTEIPMKHCNRCGTFAGNKTLKQLVPQGANLSRIILTIKEEFEVTRSFFAYTPIAFFAEIGGYLGLFIGFSLTSLADLCTWILERVRKMWKIKEDDVKMFKKMDKKEMEQ